jgi:hypothetical protein
MMRQSAAAAAALGACAGLRYAASRAQQPFSGCCCEVAGAQQQQQQQGSSSSSSSSSNDDDVRIPRPREFDAKLRGIVQGGVQHLAVISDFDRTITPCKVEGRQCASCYNMVDNALSPAMVMHKQKLFDHYYPIEIDHEISDEEKQPIMLEWYKKSNDALISERFQQSELVRAVQQARSDGILALRPGASELLAWLVSTVLSTIVQWLLPLTMSHPMQRM